jgi:hypothetical protein
VHINMRHSDSCHAADLVMRESSTVSFTGKLSSDIISYDLTSTLNVHTLTLCVLLLVFPLSFFNVFYVEEKKTHPHQDHITSLSLLSISRAV